MAKAFLTIPQLTNQEVIRFHTRYGKGSPNECWPWLSNNSYGNFKIRRRIFVASRIAYFLAFCVDPKEMLVLHTCDNPPCVNPAHLFLGTNRDNQIDARDKGLLNPPKGDNHFSRLHPEKVARGSRAGINSKPESFLHCRGETHYAAKLNEQQVHEIREMYADGCDTIQELGAYFNLSPTTIHAIIHRKKWKHI